MNSIFRQPPHQGQYKTVVLAFLDILGFKEFLDKECNNSPDFLLQLMGTADFFTNASFSTHIERRIASDSIVIWSEDWNHGLLAICNIVSLLQTTLIKKGVLIRGAIVHGKHFAQRIGQYDTSTQSHTLTSDEVIVSPALAKAVVLEKTVGLPRVVFENNPTLHHHLRQAKAIFQNFRVHDMVENGATYLDGLFTTHELLGFSKKQSPSILEGTTAEKMSEACRDQALTELKTIESFIKQGIAHKDKRVRQKWEDVRKRYDMFVKSCPSTEGLCVFPKKSFFKNWC